MEPIIITGLGIVAPNGKNVAEYWQALLQSHPVPVDSPFMNPKYAKNRLYYAIPDWEIKNNPSKNIRIGRVTDFTIEAVKMCLQDAKIDSDFENIGMSLGTGMGDNDIIDAEYERGGNVNGIESFCYNIDSVLSSYFGLTGPTTSVSTACSAGGYSISLALEAIQNGLADVMIVVGADGFLRISYASFNRIGVLDSEVCRPFDVNRKGTIFGEGAVALVLESKSHAFKRGKTDNYAEIAGCGWSCDGYHPTAPDPTSEQTVLAIQRALSEAKITPQDVDCIIPHGTGTELNDVIESETLTKVFGEKMDEVPVFALKSHVGHSGGAAGTFSCLTAALILKYGIVPPTINWTEVDPRCRIKLNHAPSTLNVKHILVNVYGFGANNISIIMRKGTS